MLKTKKKDRTAAPDVGALQLSIAEIAAESWRFERALNKMLRRMDVMDAERFARQYDYFATRVDRALAAAELTVLDLTGQPYSVGLPVQAMNLEEFDEDESLIVEQTIEPVIMLGGRVLKTGMVMVNSVRRMGQAEE